MIEIDQLCRAYEAYRLQVMRPPREPYRIKMVEPVPQTTRRRRERALAETAYNLFRLPSDLVELDLLTDSGTGAMSQTQWAALLEGDESYAGSRNYQRLRETIADVLGFPHVAPVHQGRAAEAIFFALTLEPGQVVPSNGHFDTTRAHIELQGAVALDLPAPAAHDLEAAAPFKGDVDLDRLAELLAGPDGRRVPYVMMTLTNNTGGGQPASLANVRAAASGWCSTSPGSPRTPGSSASARRAAPGSRSRRSPAACSARPTPC